VFDLAPGAVSPVLADPTGYYIYKLISKGTPAFESIREAVSVRMQNQNTVEATKRIEELSKATVDAAYFDKYRPPPPNPDEPEIDND
jgi:parvulin-like peptidyl-prolyl isomerase